VDGSRALDIGAVPVTPMSEKYIKK